VQTRQSSLVTEGPWDVGAAPLVQVRHRIAMVLTLTLGPLRWRATPVGISGHAWSGEHGPLPLPTLGPPLVYSTTDDVFVPLRLGAL